MKGLYLFIDLFSLAGPFLLSFDKKVNFRQYWKPLFISIFLMMLVFIPWDIWKTAEGVWGFNPDYISGYYFFNLPLEECLFFICIPYACVFIYECLNAYISKDLLKNWDKIIFQFIASLLLIFGILNYEKWYPAITFPFAVFLILFLIVIIRANYSGRFLLAYFVTLIPFLLVNGILTGSFIEEPVVWYNSNEIIGIRIGTIPVEDAVYNLSMFLLVILIYESIKSRLLKKS